MQFWNVGTILKVYLSRKSHLLRNDNFKCSIFAAIKVSNILRCCTHILSTYNSQYCLRQWFFRVASLIAWWGWQHQLSNNDIFLDGAVKIGGEVENILNRNKTRIIQSLFNNGSREKPKWSSFQEYVQSNGKILRFHTKIFHQKFSTKNFSSKLIGLVKNVIFEKIRGHRVHKWSKIASLSNCRY